VQGLGFVPAPPVADPRLPVTPTFVLVAALTLPLFSFLCAWRVLSAPVKTLRFCSRCTVTKLLWFNSVLRLWTNAFGACNVFLPVFNGIYMEFSIYVVSFVRFHVLIGYASQINLTGSFS